MRTQLQAEFDKVRQDRYKAALASAAGTRAGNVDILAITEGRRRAGSVKVETKVRLCVRKHENRDSSTPALKRDPVLADPRE